MISDWEQRALREVERGLMADDPRFASSFHARAAGGGTGVLRRVWLAVATVSVLVLGVLMVATGSVGTFFAFLLGLGVTGWLRHSWHDPTCPPHPPV